MFHIGSIAEYYDSWFSILLSQSVSCIDSNTKGDRDLVFNDNTLLKSAVQKYK